MRCPWIISSRYAKWIKKSQRKLVRARKYSAYKGQPRLFSRASHPILFLFLSLSPSPSHFFLNMSTSNLYEDLYNFLNFSSTDLDLSMSAGQTCYGSVFTVERNASNVVDKTKKKIYPCEFCNKSFTKPSALRSHTYTHTGEKPFACH